jgi:hypothetical protein
MDKTTRPDRLPAFPEGQAAEPLWILEAPWEILDHFSRQAGLGRDSAVPLVFTLKPDRFVEARLTYPSPQCPHPETWLRVLALLYLHHVDFKLYQATGRQGAVTSLTLLKPQIDQELEDLLGIAAQGKIQQLRGYAKMLQRVFRRLEAAASLAPEF